MPPIMAEPGVDPAAWQISTNAVSTPRQGDRARHRDTPTVRHAECNAL
jgi:hypothetical protein